VRVRGCSRSEQFLIRAQRAVARTVRELLLPVACRLSLSVVAIVLSHVDLQGRSGIASPSLLARGLRAPPRTTFGLPPPKFASLVRSVQRPTDCSSSKHGYVQPSGSLLVCDRNYIAFARTDLTPMRKRCRRSFAHCARTLFTKRSMQRRLNNPPHIREVKHVLSRSFPLVLWISAAHIREDLTCAVSRLRGRHANEKFR
jgi:hypothetical protein